MKNLLLTCSPECFKRIAKACITDYVNETSEHPQSVFNMMFDLGLTYDDISKPENRVEAACSIVALIESLCC